ncbi:MAG: DinB family protein [Gemmataceae bacterium]|nr:DinB family protein [Gemmataceae bacterium]
MHDDKRRALIEQYASGYEAVREAVEKVGAARLDVKPSDGDDWTARRITHHLADSEMTSALRLRRMVAEDEPAILAFDERVWAERLYYDGRPIEESLEAFRWARASTVGILRRLSDDEWKRKATHSDLGAYGVERWLEIYGRHAHDHADQILRIVESG